MKVLVIGATGYIGEAIAHRLLAEGHVVIGVARSSSKAASLSERGIQPLLVERGIDDIEGIVSAAHVCDAVIDAATRSFRVATALAARLCKSLGPGKILIGTTGTNFYGHVPTSSEQQPTPEDSTFGWLPRSPEKWPEGDLKIRGAIAEWWPKYESSILHGAATGVRTCIIRPSYVYGRGRGGIGGGLPERIMQARKIGASIFVDDGAMGFTPTVHVDDLADLYELVLRALQSGALAAGSIVNGSSGVEKHQAVAEAVATAAGVCVRTLTFPEAESQFGISTAESMLQSCVPSRSKALGLGWTPHRPSLVHELTSGSYANTSRL